MTYHGFSEVGPMTGEAEKACRKDKFSYYSIESRLKRILGEILTTIDATYSDKEQRKASKDLVKGIIHEAMLQAYEDATESGRSNVVCQSTN